MIRHIVFFKLKEGLPPEEGDRLIDALKGLKAKISFVRELEVGRDVGKKPNSYDIVLNTLFHTMDDVEAYAVHPDHVEVVKLVRETCQSSVKVDYPL